jgi:hypothetical protein
MLHDLDQTVALIARTPATLNVLLRDLPDSWTHSNEGDKTWSCYDVVGHLIHGERTDWIPRTKRILEFGDTKAFDRFDRFAQGRESQGKSLPQLLDEFSRLRAASIAELRAMNLTDKDLTRRGLHPELGPVTLSELLAGWAAHDLTHLHQISRIMAHQYRNSIGPWNKYMGVMLCTGHSA